MKLGGWVPIHKGLIKTIPRNRKWSEAEAVLSLSIDYERNKSATISGYAALWGWSRTRVKSFLCRLGINLEYPEKTKKNQNQKGQIALQIKSRSKTDKEQIRFIDSKWIDDAKSRSKTDKKQIKSRSLDTTIDPISSIPDPNPEYKGKFSEDSNPFRIAEFLFQNILKHKPDFLKPNIQKWSDDADKMLRIDKRDLETVKKLIAWCQADDFEKSNVLSIAKLRKRFDSLEIKMKTDGKKKPGKKYKDGERSLAELKAAAVYHEDGTITLRD